MVAANHFSFHLYCRVKIWKKKRHWDPLYRHLHSKKESNKNENQIKLNGFTCCVYRRESGFALPIQHITWIGNGLLKNPLRVTQKPFSSFSSFLRAFIFYYSLFQVRIKRPLSVQDTSSLLPPHQVFSFRLNEMTSFGQNFCLALF